MAKKGKGEKGGQEERRVGDWVGDKGKGRDNRIYIYSD